MKHAAASGFATAILLASGAAHSQAGAERESVMVEMRGAQGQPAGVVAVHQLEHGTLFFADLANIPPGGHAFHVHERGVCEGPDFESAGGHYAPLGNAHGLDNPQGYHAGDLPNIHATNDGRVRAEFFVPHLVFAGGEPDGPFPLRDSDGSAIMIHENADNYRDEPPGTGARIACGVIFPPA